MSLAKIIALFEDFEETDRALMHLSQQLAEKVQHLELMYVQLEERVHQLENQHTNKEAEK